MDARNKAVLDQFAGQAMQSLIYHRESEEGISWDSLARDAYSAAYAMMAERERHRDTLGRYIEPPEAPVKSLGLTQRTINCLASDGIYTINELLSYSPLDLIRMPGMGKKSLAEIKDRVEEYGGLSSKSRNGWKE